MFEHQTDWDTCQLPFAYAYNLQVQRSINVLVFILEYTHTELKLSTVVPIRTNLVMDDDIALTFYDKLERIKLDTGLHKKRLLWPWL